MHILSYPQAGIAAQSEPRHCEIENASGDAVMITAGSANLGALGGLKPGAHVDMQRERGTNACICTCVHRAQNGGNSKLGV
jgi:hypothetical protein